MRGRSLGRVADIVSQLSLYRPSEIFVAPALWKFAAALFALMLIAMAANAQTGTELRSYDSAPLIVDGVSESDVFSMGRSVEVTGTIKKGVIAFGGDVVVIGRVEGDVAAIGGSVIQQEGSYIGGDVLVFGGAYHHGKSAPGRREESMTVMYAGYEQELREMMRNPLSVLTPQWSASYIGQRLLAGLFWLLVSLSLTAITPGAVSRAVARLQLTNVRVAVIGMFGAVASTFGVMACLHVLPVPIGVLIGIMALLLVMMAYVFGRVAIHAATGRWLQRKFLSEGKRSETFALLIGTGFWTVMLSLPFIWPLVVAGLMVTSIGLTLTARYRLAWKQPAAQN
jgi:hypothetical protein